jgi:hypothetical protein
MFAAGCGGEKDGGHDEKNQAAVADVATHRKEVMKPDDSKDADYSK